MQQIARNLRVLCQWRDDGGYECVVDLFDEWTQAWEQDVPYVAREGDPAPVNKWIIEQIATGSYGPFEACLVTDE